MARLGLGARWDCLFANDFDAVKAATYRANFGAEHFDEGDVWALQRARPARPRRPRLGVQPLPGPQPRRRAGRPGRRALVGLLGLLAADARRWTARAARRG